MLHDLSDLLPTTHAVTVEDKAIAGTALR